MSIEVWVHLGGDDENGRCLTCIMQADACEHEEPVRPHRPYPDTDSTDDDIWCWICGHSVGILGGKESDCAVVGPNCEAVRLDGFSVSRQIRAVFRCEMCEPVISRCPACGDIIDYCQGHGEIGDPAGWRILQDHDAGWHASCDPYGCHEGA